MVQAIRTEQLSYNDGHNVAPNGDFTGDTSNVVELFHHQELLRSLQIALHMRAYDPRFLYSNDDGWFLYDIWLGNNLKGAYRWVIDWW